MPEMVIDSIRVSLMNYQRVVILKEKEADRYLPIWIGPAEADAIAVKLQQIAVPRPLTHDLLRVVITELGAGIDQITVYDLQGDTFYARISLKFNGETMDVDSRPSDAIALAVRTEAPIFVSDDVLDKAGIVLDESGKPIGGEEQSTEGIPQEVQEDELRRMSAFTDFINTLDLEDLGKGQDKGQE